MTSPVMWLSGGCGSTLIPTRTAEPTTRPDHVIDFLHRLTVRCVQVLDLSAAGLLLTDQLGGAARGGCIDRTSLAAGTAAAVDRRGRVPGVRLLRRGVGTHGRPSGPEGSKGDPS